MLMYYRQAWTEIVNEQITESLEKVTDMNVFPDELELDKPELNKTETEKTDGKKAEEAESDKTENAGIIIWFLIYYLRP